MKTIISTITAVILLTLVVCSCGEFLDVVPDNVATIDNTFSTKTEAEKYLFTCYSYLPRDQDIWFNPAFLSGDEFWTYWPITAISQLPIEPTRIARGEQNITTPFLNYWNGESSGKPLFKAIRDCNIFLENINKVFDLDEFERQRWIGEVEFLKAYYHFYLFRMYGPIPITDKNLPITASTDEVRVYREPVDKVVNYIAGLLDSAAVKLPVRIEARNSELGRVTRPIALAMKARLLVTAASPLFNGNTDYSNVQNSDGTFLFNAVHDNEKWTKAAVACKAAIDVCEAAGHSLYNFTNNLITVSDRLRAEMSIRNSVCEKWNREIIWGSTAANSTPLQLQSIPRLDPAKTVNETTLGQLAPTMKIAEMFYSENGVPIDEDKTWDVAGMYALRTATTEDADQLQEGYETVGLHFDREPRFYANLAFDGAIWFMQNGTWNIQAKSGQTQARKGAFGYSATGYYAKKLVNWKFEILDGQSYSTEDYPWPVIRLADIYMMYAEALNEAGGPTAEVYDYVNKIRTRAGLQSVEQSWINYSVNPTKYTNQAGMREIIHRERLIEFALEGSRFWDLRRWKEALEEMSKPVYGWDIEQETTANYYRRKQLFTPSFIAPRDYLWPVKSYDIIVNRRLVQNPGW